MSTQSSLPLFGAPPQTNSRGPAIFAKGFRPFFLLGALGAAVMVPLWMVFLFGSATAPSYLDAMSWHAHEMVFGFASAIVAGFLLTAVGNWTGRETATGTALASLSALWIAGRFALVVPGLPKIVVAAIDIAFLPALAITIARPLVATKNRRNLVMVLVLLALLGANLAVHLDALGVITGGRRMGALLAVDVLVVLIAIIAGRVFPMFTKNATNDASIRSHPRLDILAVIALALVTVLDLAQVSGVTLAVVCAIAAVLSVARSIHWGARSSVSNPMLWILHLAHAWIPLGLFLRTASAFDAHVPSALATHALTAGAIGCATIGMMARVSLGHTGRKIVASRTTVAAFLFMLGAGVTRVVGPLLFVAAYREWLVVSTVLWSAAFVAFLAGYVPILVRPRIDGTSG